MSDEASTRRDGAMVMPGRLRHVDGWWAIADLESANLIFFLILFVIALLPVLATPIPAMVDYVNHLARMYVLAADGTPDASPFYRVSWALYPNLAMDLVVPRLARIMSVETATRAFLVLSQILTVTGAVAIELAVKRRFAFAGYVALMMLYSIPFAWGFVNFEFALGLALWGLACWLAIREQAWALRFGAHASFVALLFISHLFALGLYGIALGVHELWRAREGRAPAREFLATMTMLAAPVAALLIIMHASGGSAGQAGSIWFVAMKPFWLFASLNGYSVTLSAVCTTVLVFLIHALARRRALRFAASGAWLLAGFGLLYLVIPDRMLDTAFVDLRVIVAAALIVPAFVTVSFPSERWRLAAMGAVVAITLINAADAASVAISYDGTYSAMVASFSQLKKGSRVLVAHSGESDDPPLRDLSDYPIYHAPTLAVHYANAFVPTLFTTMGKQPITVVAEDQRLTASCGGPVPVALLSRIAAGRVSSETPPFIRTWMRDFDYLYVVGPQAPNPMPSRLEPMRTHPRFALYRIRKEG